MRKNNSDCFADLPCAVCFPQSNRKTTSTKPEDAAPEMTEMSGGGVQNEAGVDTNLSIFWKLTVQHWGVSHIRSKKLPLQTTPSSGLGTNLTFPQ